MITVLVGHTKGNEDITYPDKRLPHEVADHITENLGKEVTMRTYTATPINVLGEVVELGLINKSELVIICDGGTYHFDDTGVLTDSLPWGIFNY